MKKDNHSDKKKNDDYTVDNLDIILAQAGDATALNRVTEQLFPLLTTICSKYYIKGGDNADLVQEAALAAVKAIKTYVPGSKASFNTYMTTCVKNRIYDVIKQSEAEKNKLLNESEPLPPAEEIPGEERNRFLDIENEEKANELLSKIKNVLSKLEFEVFSYVYDGYSYKEIAEKTGKTEKSVDNALQRIKKKIKEANIL